MEHNYLLINIFLIHLTRYVHFTFNINKMTQPYMMMSLLKNPDVSCTVVYLTLVQNLKAKLDYAI